MSFRNECHVNQLIKLFHKVFIRNECHVNQLTKIFHKVFNRNECHVKQLTEIFHKVFNRNECHVKQLTKIFRKVLLGLNITKENHFSFSSFDDFRDIYDGRVRCYLTFRL